MKKQELQHIHGLLSEILNYYEGSGVDIDTESYDDLGVMPTSIHRSKTDHKVAVLELATAITDGLRTREALVGFSEDQVYGGRIAPVENSERLFMKLILNEAKKDPYRFQKYLPLLIGPIKHGTEETHKHILEILQLYESELEEMNIQEEFYEAVREVTNSKYSKQLAAEIESN